MKSSVSALRLGAWRRYGHAMSSHSARHEVRCQVCGELLGHLNSAHDQVVIAWGVPYCLTFGVQRFDLICPSCGHCRSFTMVEITRLAKRPMLESAAN